ncbi:MAG: hypothetical protein Q7S28_02930 [bacterium]|nr:hypothetical protein [bacterium]
MIKKWFLRLVYLVAGALVVIILLSFLGRLHAPKTTTFFVQVPAHTPELDAIVLHVEEELFVMEKIGPHEYRKEVPTEDYEFERPLRYGYTRGGFQVFGEDSFSGNVGSRNFTPGKDAEKRDTVSSWKWSSVETVRADLPSSAKTAHIAPRPEFWAGPDMVDFWNPTFPNQYEATIAHLKAMGYKWIELDPPWDYRSLDPVLISGENVQVPSWPEEEIRKEIRVFKAAGFKIFLGPQVCCTAVDFKDRSAEWWTRWYDEYENFVRVFANLAKEEGVSAFAISGPEPSLPGAPEALPFAAERWDRILSAAKTSGAPIGFSFHILSPGERPQPPWPQEATTFYGKLDFLAFAFWNHVSDKIYPAQAEIDAALALIFRDLDLAHEKSGKPVVFAQIAYFSKKGAAQAKGPEEFPTWEDPKKHADNYDAKTQAMVYEGLMRQVASRSYVRGMFPFGYWYLDAPLNLDSDIRSKPAEGIFTEWLKRFD